MSGARLQCFDRPDVECFLREWETLFERGEYARMAAYYAEDAELIGTNIETIAGRAAIESFWRTASEGAHAGGFRRTVRMTDASSAGTLAYIRGEVQVHRPGASEAVRVRYVTLWRREADGVWRLAVDISSAAPIEEQRTPTR